MRTLEQASTVTAGARALLLELKRIVHEHVPSATVLLYGSVARGAQGPESDYDVLVLTEHPVSKVERADLENKIYDLELEREAVLSTLYCSWDQWNSPLWRGSTFYDEVQRDGVRL
jgi:predicted nucleotidyltransferase